MNLKVLFLAFLCLFSASIICNVSMVMLNAAEGWSCEASRHVVHVGYILTNGTEPAGDPIVDGGWP